MPHFVTDISAPHRAPTRWARRLAPAHDRAQERDAYRRRLSALCTRAPHTLRDRVRRELREAAASMTATE